MLLLHNSTQSKPLYNNLKVVGILLFAFVLPLPLPLKFSSGAMILMLVNLLLIKSDVKPKEIFSNYFFLILVSFFLADVVRSIIATESHYPLFKEVKIPFLVIPFIFLLKRDVLKGLLDKIFMAFILGVIGYIVYAWSYVIYFYTVKYPHYEFSLTNGYLRYLFYNYLPNTIHHTYFGMYLTIASVIVYLNTIVYRKIALRNGFILTSFFGINAFYLGGKGTMLLMIVLLIAITIYAYQYKLQIKRATFFKLLGSLLLVIGVGTLFIWEWLLLSIQSSFDQRLAIYTCDLEVFFSHPMTGVGFKNIAASSSLCSGYALELITHNFILNELVANGILGGLLLVSIIVFVVYQAIKSKDPLFISLVFLVFPLGFIEDIFSRQWGVLFFTFFATLLYIKNMNDSKSEPVLK